MEFVEPPINDIRTSMIYIGLLKESLNGDSNQFHIMLLTTFVIESCIEYVWAREGITL